jgi:hypothetical protein
MREADNKYTNSYLFLVRLWQADAHNENDEWHGKVQHVITGKADVFDGWPMLVSLLQSMLSGESRKSNDS